MSTGPTGGSGGTTGPGHFLAALMEHLRASRARSAKAAAVAGARGESPKPLTRQARQANYRRQNGVDVEGRLTPRQRRRDEHKAARAAVKAG